MASIVLDRYKIKLTLTRGLLATNPSDPAVHDTHILERQRKLILEKSELNTKINKYLDALPITAEKGEAEVCKLIDSLEALLGYQLTSEQRQDAVRGKLDSLKETIGELDIKGATVFFWDKATNMPVLGSHCINGFLKAAAEAIGRTLDTKKGEMLHSISYTQSVINQHFRVEQEFIAVSKDVLRKPDGEVDWFQRPLRAMTAQGPRVTVAKSEMIPAGAEIEFTALVLKNSPLTQEVLETLFSYGQIVGLGQWRTSSKGSFSYTLKKLE